MDKVLIIGDSPKISGGVVNYTRPLSQALSKFCDVYYLFNSTATKNNSFFKKTGIYPVYEKEFDFKCFQLINGKSVYKNYNQLSNDYSNWFDDLFLEFIDKINPQTIHINEFFGFSTSIFSSIKKRGIKLIVSVHEYWWLCPHRVMVDFNRKICSGPENIQKCTFCVSKQRSKYSPKMELFIDKTKFTFPFLFDFLINLKNKKDETLSFEDLSFGSLDYSNFKDEELYDSIKNRLDKLIEALNLCDVIIGVSSDVKRHLIKYGVNADKIIIQHIGSIVAEKKGTHSKKVDENEIVFGFIGGVGYYKGVHQLVEAYVKLPERLKLKSKLLIYGKYDDSYLNSIKRDFIESRLDKERIVFYGRFTPIDVPEITNKIDINILPSLCADTAPQTIFESFSNGLPIIAPIVGGFPDFIVDGLNGLLYEKASVNGILNCLTKIINEPALISKFRSNIPECKSISENVDELIQIYNGN